MLRVAGTETTTDAVVPVPRKVYSPFAGTKKPVTLINYSETPWDPEKPMLHLSPAEVEVKIGAGFRFVDGVYMVMGEEGPICEALPHVTLHRDSWCPQSNYLTEAVRSFLAEENYRKLVLCNSSSGVGHMVVAATDISVGDVVAIYSGVLNYRRALPVVSSDHVTQASGEIASAISEGKAPPIDLHLYSCDMPMNSFEGRLLLNAERLSGMARFFNHLPFDVSARIDEHLAFLRAFDRSYFSKYLGLDLPEEYPAIIRSSIVEGKKPLVSLMAHIFRHFMGLIPAKAPCFSTRVREGCGKKIATANLYIGAVKLPEIMPPLLVLIACSSIKAGEQVGWYYGDAYEAYLKAVNHLYFDRESKEVINPEDLMMDSSEPSMMSARAGAGSASSSTGPDGASGASLGAGPGAVSDLSGGSSSSAASSTADREKKLLKIMPEYLNFAVFFITNIRLQGEWVKHPGDSTGLTYYLILRSALTEVDFGRSKNAMKTAGFFLRKVTSNKGKESLLANCEVPSLLESLCPSKKL